MNKAGNSDLTVIIPTINEEEGIGPTLRELREVLEDPSYLVVDGNSVDRTVEIAKEMGARVVMQDGMGKGQAVTQALRCVNSDARYVAFIDADFTYPAKYLPEMIKVLEDNPDVGMVNGNRFNDFFILKNAMHNLFYLGNRLLATVHYLLNGANLEDPLTGLRVLRCEALKNWRPKSRGFDVEVELNHFIVNKGYRIVEVPIEYRRRLGEKKLKLIHGFTILKRILLQSLT